ncbi:MAG: phosphatidylserine/phosphatidylglycerophosphate/cardiolipin synthase family protein [Verrucomicrobiota bacterium]
MAGSRWKLVVFGLLPAAPVLLGSCSQVSSNARQLQAADTLTGSGNLAAAAFRATAVAAVRQPVTSARLGLSVLWQRPREIISGNLPFEVMPQPLPAESPGSLEFETMLDRKGFPRAESGTLKWLVDGGAFFPELDRRIASARESIDVQVYIFDNDDIAVRYADLLKSRAGALKVRVLFDDMGSTFSHTTAPGTPRPAGFTPPADIHDHLQKDSKLRARRILNPWLVADHTKLLVFDHRSAILGGMNIGREYYSEWHDLMVAVEGPVVDSLSREFRRAWRKAGPWGDLALFRQPAIFRHPKPVTGGIPLRVLRTDPAEGKRQILEASLLAIRGARKRVWIENPYFAHDDIALATAAAARRGVDVRVVLPAAGDSSLMDEGNLATANSLIRAGAKVFRYPQMTHMKVMVCDDWASVGSANFDTLSMRINRELNLAFSHPAAVRGLEKAVFLPDFRRSRRMDLAETESAASGLAEAIADQL